VGGVAAQAVHPAVLAPVSGEWQALVRVRWAVWAGGAWVAERAAEAAAEVAYSAWMSARIGVSRSAVVASLAPR
jgi:hypothetical protein